jgi:hypothetical protein
MTDVNKEVPFLQCHGESVCKLLDDLSLILYRHLDHSLELIKTIVWEKTCSIQTACPSHSVMDYIIFMIQNVRPLRQSRNLSMQCL